MIETRAIGGLREIADDYDVYLVDQWGVLHDGHAAHEPAINAMHQLKSRDKKLLILSNSSRRASTTHRNLVRLNIDPYLFDSFITSGEEVWQAFRSRDDAFYATLGSRCLVLQWGKDDQFFEDLDLEPVDEIDDAEFILLNGTEKDRFSEYDILLRHAAERCIPMVCTNGDFISIMPDGKLVQCPGVVARRYEALGGQVRWHGKPTEGVYRMALTDTSENARILAIGDSLFHDIGGALANGLASLFVSGGIHRPELQETSTGYHSPTDLARIYAQYNATPTYVTRELAW